MLGAEEFWLIEHITLNDRKAAIERTGGNGKRVRSHRDSGGTHPGTEHRAMGACLMMRVMTFVDDRLGRSNTADS